MSNYSFKANPGIQTQRGTALSIQTVFTQIILLSRKLFTWDDLQQQHEFQPIPEVLLDVLNLRACFPQVGVTPSCKCLQTEKKRWREREIISQCTYTHVICSANNDRCVCGSHIWWWGRRSLRIFAHRVIKSTLLYNLLTVARVQCIKPCKDNLSKGRIIFGSVNIRATGWRIREGGFCPTEKQPNGNPKKSAVRGKSKVEGSLISKLALASSQEDCFCTVTVNCTWAAQNFLANWMRWIRF